jgi:hypothetical protein
VYNDSSFSEADIKGIQCLGIGSKGDDPTKTGQYGVGFNAVYHLTDVPSFLTRGEDVETGELLFEIKFLTNSSVISCEEIFDVGANSDVLSGSLNIVPFSFINKSSR